MHIGAEEAGNGVEGTVVERVAGAGVGGDASGGAVAGSLWDGPVVDEEANRKEFEKARQDFLQGGVAAGAGRALGRVEEQSFAAAAQHKSCFECYTLFSKEEGISEQRRGVGGGGRLFCSRACLGKYHKSRRVKCQSDNCFQMFLSGQGVRLNGRLVCKTCADPPSAPLATVQSPSTQVRCLQRASAEATEEAEEEDVASSEEEPSPRTPARALPQSPVAAPRVGTPRLATGEVQAPEVTFPDEDEDDIL